MQWMRTKSASQDQPLVETSDALSASDLEARLYDEVMAVAHEHPSLNLNDYDLPTIRQTIIRPLAAYMSRRIQGLPTTPQAPLIISGEPGIGKTTLLMMIDHALTRMPLTASFSSRAIVGTGQISGYYSAFKGALQVTPLTLGQTRTAVLSILDWRNTQRHWTFDSQTTYRETPDATADFLRAFTDRIVFVDDAEREGHVYVVSQLAQQGILVVISSNLDYKALHIDHLSPLTVHLTGRDHRVGDIAMVCLPQMPHPVFDTTRSLPSLFPQPYERFKIVQREEGRVAFAQWSSIKDQPYLKDTFAEYLRGHTVRGVLIDGVPFFSGVASEDVNPGFLGHLYRFVHLVDAVHDLQLPLLVRTTRSQPLPSEYRGAEIEAALLAYDQRVPGRTGATAWVEMARCVSRLRSRQALNAGFFR